jgi:hypothetical protein
MEERLAQNDHFSAAAPQVARLPQQSVAIAHEELCDQQQASGPDARITLVQFDSQDPQEVVLSGAPILQATPLDATICQPRGGTPLLDATARLIERARLEARIRAANGLPPEHIVLVSITDGEENCSRETTLERVREQIAACEAQGWTFVFLSASLAAYQEAGSMGIRQGARMHFAASGEGTRMAMQSLSMRLTDFRANRRRGAAAEGEDFFGGELPKDEAAQ